jgi:hypothetical protein
LRSPCEIALGNPKRGILGYPRLNINAWLVSFVLQMKTARSAMPICAPSLFKYTGYDRFSRRPIWRLDAAPWRRDCELILSQAAALDIPPVNSNPTQEKQDDEDNQDDADDTDAAMTIAIAVTTEAAAEAAEQENDEDNDEYESE